MAGSQCHFVVLVHGTFTDARRFRKSAERLCERLKRDSGATILHHCWTGENRHSARERAAERLLRHLERVRRAHPSAIISVVAHSHGGNVVLLALANSGADAPVDRVVFIATPFLSVRPRATFSGEKVAGAHSFLFPLAFAAAVVFLLGRSAILTLEFSATTLHVKTAAAVLRWLEQHAEELGFGLLLACVPVCVAIFRVIGSLNERCHRKAWDLLAYRMLDDSWRGRVLIVRPVADEAGMILVAAQFLSFVSNRVGALVGTVLHRADKLAGRSLELLCTGIVGRLFLILCGCAMAAVFFARGTVQHLGGVFVGSIFAFWPKVLMGGIALSLLLGAISIVRSVPATILLAAFGWDLFGLGWRLEVTSESTPPGTWTTYLAQPPDRAAPRVLGFSHQEIYSQPDVIDRIVHWLFAANADTSASDEGSSR